MAARIAATIGYIAVAGLTWVVVSVVGAPANLQLYVDRFWLGAATTTLALVALVGLVAVWAGPARNQASREGRGDSA
ncbi:MAG: hypothetical protein OEV37_01150 [Candidatus Berkelbacteria bacterium]|nr:hypothetical protein [Candidatus Berkelbacteria bacterium]